MEFDGYFEMQEDEERQENGIMTYNSIQEVVSRYVGAVKMFDSIIDASFLFAFITVFNGLF